MPQTSQRSRLLEQLFHEHFETLCLQSYHVVKDWDLSREIVQGAFTRIWQNENVWEDPDGAIAYLSRSVKNASIDSWRKKKRHDDYVEYSLHTQESEVETEEIDHKSVITQKLAIAIEKLPDKMRNIFLLHYQEGLTYKEVAAHLELPDRTVEYNITTAYKRIRKVLESDAEFMDIYLQSIVIFLLAELKTITDI